MYTIIDYFKYIWRKQGWIYLLFCLTLLTSLFGKNIYFIVLFSCVALVKYLKFSRQISTLFVLTLFFSLSYAVIFMLTAEVPSMFNQISYLIAPAAFLLYGDRTGQSTHTEKEGIYFWLIAIALFSVFLYWNVVTDTMRVGLVNPSRVVKQVVGGIDSRGATGYGLVASLGYVGLAYFFIDLKPLKDSTKWWFLGLFFFSLLTSVHLITRSGLIVGGVCLMVMLGLLSPKKLFGAAIVAVVLFVAFQLIVSQSSIIEVTDAYSGRADDLDTGGGRSWRWAGAFSNLLVYPFGWGTIPYIYHYYAHNLWLDVARVSGLIPFFLLVSVYVLAFKDVARIVRRRRDNKLAFLIVGVNVCFFLSSFVEPVIECLPVYFYLYMMLIGYQHGLLRNKALWNSAAVPRLLSPKTSVGNSRKGSVYYG